MVVLELSAEVRIPYRKGHNNVDIEKSTGLVWLLLLSRDSYALIGHGG